MSDEQWLSAIRRYHSEASAGPMRGGAVELSRVLEAEVKEDPRRFETLASASRTRRIIITSTPYLEDSEMRRARSSQRACSTSSALPRTTGEPWGQVDRAPTRACGEREGS